MMPYNKQSNGDLLPDKRPAERHRSMVPYIIAVVCLVIAAGGYYAWKYLPFARKPKQVVISDTVELKVYAPLPPSKLGARSVSVKATLTDREKADAIMAALKAEKVLPDGIVLTEFAAGPDGTLFLNFSHELATMKLDPLAEVQTVYSIINSFLANFTRAKSVQLLAGGQAFFTINGTMYTYKPLEFNSQILED